MIQAVMFDLDGTLVQTEALKARAYATAVQKVLGLSAPDERALEVYQEKIGSPRDVTSRHMMERLGLETELRRLAADSGADEPWDVLTTMREVEYDRLISDPQVLRDNQWPHTVEPLRTAKESNCGTALTTMSTRHEAMQVVEALELGPLLDVVLTREDVVNAKPDPEIYLEAARRLGVRPEDRLVLEDSPQGARAGVTAGANVIALATPLTSMGLHEKRVVEHGYIVHDPHELLAVVRQRIAEHNQVGH